MPIYEYACDGCQSRFEVQQKISDPPISTCATCGAAVKKVISAPAIMFKGSGWYVTDYSDKLKPPSGSESAGKPSGDEKTQAETKPAADASGNGASTGGTAAAAPAPSGGSTSSTAPSSSSSTGSSST